MRSEEEILADKMDEIDLQLKYLEYSINCLEKKQVA